MQKHHWLSRKTRKIRYERVLINISNFELLKDVTYSPVELGVNLDKIDKKRRLVPIEAVADESTEIIAQRESVKCLYMLGKCI